MKQLFQTIIRNAAHARIFHNLRIPNLRVRFNVEKQTDVQFFETCFLLMRLITLVNITTMQQVT